VPGTRQPAAAAVEAEGRASSWWRRLATALGGEGGAERRRRRAAALALYRALVERARDPFLFERLGVPDTREGRLEAVMLHAILVMRRLQTAGGAGRALSQELFDLMFADIDQHMREWGVGDLSVGRNVKKVAQTFYARAAALEPALADGDPDALVPVLARNVYGVEPTEAPPAALGLGRYLVGQAARLRGQPDAALLEGRPGLVGAASATAD
jgi:cytochrome b pre-mRNA-processing protein 3